VHYGGLPCDMKSLLKIAKKNKIILIEDAAHALGARYKNKPIGSISDFTTFSFQAIKHFTTGDGGILTIKNKKLEEKIEVASRLEILDFEVIGIFRNGSEKKNSFRNRSLDRLSINLTLNENDLAKIEVVDVYISIEKPNGEIIYDISKGSGTFTYEKREEFYTIKEGVLVDRSKKELSINYIKNQEFDKGLHKVHFYTNEYKIGSGEFLIK